MTITNEQIQVLVNLFSLALLVVTWRFVWLPFATRRFRQDLFDLRDSLFDKVASGETTLTFDSKAYCDLRNDLNTMIRFANRLGFVRLLFVGRFFRAERSAARAKAAEARKNLSEEERNLVTDIDRQQSRIIFRYYLHASLLLWCLLIVVATFALIIAAIEYLRTGAMTLRSIINKIVVEPAVIEAEYQSGQSLLFGKS